MNTTVPMTTERLEVPGASLYYEVRGSGPVLLMMPGGPADAGAFRRIAENLASDYTVVTYDPRGLSHSTLEAPVQDERIVEIFADDVHRLLTATATAPAFVFASSGGAVIGLELAAAIQSRFARSCHTSRQPRHCCQTPRASGRPWKRSTKRTARPELGRPCRSSWFRRGSVAVHHRLPRANRHPRCATRWLRCSGTWTSGSGISSEALPPMSPTSTP